MYNAAVHGDAQAVAAWLDGGGGVDATSTGHHTLLLGPQLEDRRRWCGCCCSAARASTTNTLWVPQHIVFDVVDVLRLARFITADGAAPPEKP